MVVDFKKEYGKKKLALARAAAYLNQKSTSNDFKNVYRNEDNSLSTFNTRLEISEALLELSDLNTMRFENGMSLSDYVGGLKGMEVVKSFIPEGRVRFLETGTVIQDVEGLENIRFYVLGPPAMWTDIKMEHGEEGETYKHNKELELVRAFSSLPFEFEESENLPFDEQYVIRPGEQGYKHLNDHYTSEKYRSIDYDWLMSAGNLSLRLTQGINNLSAVLAIEFIDSGKVMLFPGDAEYGSWKTWHEIEWTEKGKDGVTHLTEDLLRRTVFYKVAHHLSHNGTPKNGGMDMLTNPDLVAMATLDYNSIGKNWKNTMPNRGLIKDLIKATKGKLIISNPDDMFVDKEQNSPLDVAIQTEFENLSASAQNDFSFIEDPAGLFKEYTVDGSA